MMAAAVMIAGSGLLPHVTYAQQPGITRTDALQHDLGVQRHEVIQLRVDFEPGWRSHPGEEIAYVLEGTLEYQFENDPPVTLNAGQALFIAAGAIHAAKNVGTGNAAELATCIVDKGNRSSCWPSEPEERRSADCRAHHHPQAGANAAPHPAAGAESRAHVLTLVTNDLGVRAFSFTLGT